MILHKYCLVFVGKYQNIDYFDIQSFEGGLCLEFSKTYLHSWFTIIILFMLWCYSLYITHKQQNKTSKVYRYNYLFNTPSTSWVDEKDTFRNIIHVEYIKINFFPADDIFVISMLESGKTAFVCW